LSLFTIRALGGGSAVADGPLDWSKLKADIVATLDVAAEYQTLGVKFSQSVADAKGRRECHAIGRPDLSPSAFVNVTTGVYHDAGGEGESLHLFAFAVRYGGFGRWIDAAKHFAEKAGIAIGKVDFRSRGRVADGRFEYRDETDTPRYAVFKRAWSPPRITGAQRSRIRPGRSSSITSRAGPASSCPTTTRQAWPMP
jgi:hypothetical protein